MPEKYSSAPCTATNDMSNHTTSTGTKEELRLPSHLRRPATPNAKPKQIEESLHGQTAEKQSQQDQASEGHQHRVLEVALKPQNGES